MKTLDYYRQLPYRVHSEIIQEPDGSRYWIAEYVDLRGCKTEGKTQAEAIHNVQELFDEYISERLKLGHEIPEPAVIHHLIPSIEVEVSPWIYSQAQGQSTVAYKTDRTNNIHKFEEAEIA